MRDYYASHAAGTDPFNWVRIHPLMSAEIQRAYPFDHAGIGETSLMMALAPEAVDVGRIGANTAWYTETAREASAELGEKGAALILAHLRGLLGTGARA
jgi:creatinine amidohydrolase